MLYVVFQYSSLTFLEREGYEVEVQPNRKWMIYIYIAFIYIYIIFYT